LEWGEIPPQAPLVGFVFGFPGLYITPDGPRPKHCSHMLGVHPNQRDQGTGFKLNRAQWQMVRHQGLDRITWTYDPLLSRNGHLNIARLGAVCNTYIREAYGEMRDGLNAGLPSDRFQVDWWIRSQRVNRRLSKRLRRPLDLAHFLAAETAILNPSEIGMDGLPRPPAAFQLGEIKNVHAQQEEQPLLLLEIPADFLALKAASPALALEWRLHTRHLFEALFKRGYLVTDFVHLPGTYARSFYVLSYGEAKV
jgi:predicted GNAT superfamily acetyltransferase